MRVRGVRGAITIERDERDLLLEATGRLLREMIGRNGIDTADICSIILSATPDIRSAFPAEAARRMGLTDVPLFCAAEIDVEGALPLCIRALMHINTEKSQKEIIHVYLEGAKALRPDLT